MNYILTKYVFKAICEKAILHGAGSRIRWILFEAIGFPRTSALLVLAIAFHRSLPKLVQLYGAHSFQVSDAFRSFFLLYDIS